MITSDIDKREHESMRFEELSYKDIEELVKEGYIPVIPVGSLEVHGPHLPLGTDGLVIHKLALEVAKIEKIVVLPPLYYAYVPENRHFPGTISLTAETFHKLLEEICDELGRMGFKKIVILNGHGGNIVPISLFVRELLWKRKGYKVYAINSPWGCIQDEIEKIRESEIVGHAGEIETSLVLYVNPNLVKKERIPGKAKLGPRRVVNGAETPVDWVGHALEGYVGEPGKASYEKGEKLFKVWAKRVAEFIRKIREDTYYDKVVNEYNRRSQPL